MSHTQDSRRAPKEPVNAVQQHSILTETIRKEMATYQPYTNFSINPFKPMYTVTGKPNSFHDAEMDQGPEDPVMKEIIGLAHKPPTSKHIRPQTSSQEYGWMTQPLLKLDRSDTRLHHPKKLTDVTKPKEAEWQLKEQTENLN